MLSDSMEPFLCPSCTAANQQAAILGLHDCLNALTDEVKVMKTMVAALQKQFEKAETPELQATIAALQRSEDRGSSTKVVPKPSRVWNVVAAKGVMKKIVAGNQARKGDEGQKRDVSKQEAQRPGSEKNKEARTTHSTSGRVLVKANPDFKKLESGDGGDGGKVKVEGARRVCGTMRVCTETAIKSAIARFCAIKSI